MPGNFLNKHDYLAILFDAAVNSITRDVASFALRSAWLNVSFKVRPCCAIAEIDAANSFTAPDIALTFEFVCRDADTALETRIVSSLATPVKRLQGDFPFVDVSQRQILRNG
ncbi:hypothetical protein [Bradyrhizobium sp. CCBAU 11361]|uniref:hypothetical protein n=1 Tax=Bradyrhizobium sp. CCBAU 11361 TaxID=1630812 RepID=UPI0023053DD6|nr:hypothetical protein [Bradyrhizobium sp. CCBAU 11361]